MVEVCNKLLDEVLRKDSHIDMEWDQCIQQSWMYWYPNNPSPGILVNLHTLRRPSRNLRYYCQTSSSSGRDIRSWAEELEDPVRPEKAIQDYLIHKAEIHDIVTEASDRRKDEEATRHNRGVRQVIHHIRDLVMLHQKTSRKLEARRRGPFQISDYGGSHGHSFKL